jgi:uncharacterized protein
MIRFEWHEAKNRNNEKKHGIDFQTAQLVFEDPYCITFIERISDNEQRWHAIGSIEEIIIIVVVHTHRVEGADEIIRIISARRATTHERNLYAQTNR